MPTTKNGNRMNPDQCGGQGSFRKSEFVTGGWTMWSRMTGLPNFQMQTLRNSRSHDGHDNHRKIPVSDGTNDIFNPAQYKERCGLLLLKWLSTPPRASHRHPAVHRWIKGFDEHTLAQTSVLNITPNGNEAATLMAGAGLAADSSNNIYFLAGNGTFDTTLN